MTWRSQFDYGPNDTPTFMQLNARRSAQLYDARQYEEPGREKALERIAQAFTEACLELGFATENSRLARKTRQANARPKAKVPDGPRPTSKPPVHDKDRGLVCRMAGNIAGDLMNYQCLLRAGHADQQELIDVVPAAALDLAEAIVAEYDRRRG